MRLSSNWYRGVILGALVVASGCGQAEKQPSSAQKQMMLAELAPEEIKIAADDTPAGISVGPATAAASRLLIYHADVRLKTSALPRAAASLDSLVRRSKGYLSAATETRADGKWRQESTIRVPPAQFQSLLNGLAGLGTVEEKKLSTDDITAEHADVAARLQAKRAVERQYTVLLAKAQKIKDILDIEEKLGSVREEIEATESRLRALNDEVAYSTITLTLYQTLPQAVPDAPVVSLGSRTVEAFYGGWQFFISLLLGVLYVWPLALLAGLAGGLFWRRHANVKARRPASASTT